MSLNIKLQHISGYKYQPHTEFATFAAFAVSRDTPLSIFSICVDRYFQFIVSFVLCYLHDLCVEKKSPRTSLDFVVINKREELFL